MAKGKVTVHLTEHPSKENIELVDFNSRALTEVITVPSDVCITESCEVVRYEKLPSDWESYSVDVYEKSNLENGIATYKFTEARMVERCKAMTKQGTRCMKAAKHLKSYCSITHGNEPDSSK
ncbi:TPA: hypothetical protein NJZ13_000527 [Vibrio parahaemolyticus]|nr:hypothetical protein [Vibrio parahaemolyticus]HCH1698461.1 hypothetical protein [Vibrio parahaemolyticus]